MAGYGQLFSGDDCFDILSVLDFPMEGLEGEEDGDWEPNLQGLPPIPAEAIPSDIGFQSSSMLPNPNSIPYLNENSSSCSFEKKISMPISSEFSIPHCARNKRSKRSRCSRFHPWFEMPCIPCKNPSASIQASNMKRNLSKPSAPAAIRMKKNSTEWHAGDATRKCTHCEVTKTPQWREGPLGPKTLCNACGVRYRSGRLFPEYRPAASPTFVPSLHSNSHRKVIEIRKIAEMEVATNEAEAVPVTLPPHEFMVTCLFDNMVR